MLRTALTNDRLPSMDRKTQTVLTWLTVVAAVVSALWLAIGGSVKRYGAAPLALGRPMPPAEAGIKASRHGAPPATPRQSAADPRR